MIKFHIFFSVSCLSLFHIFPSKSLLITSHHRHPDLYCPPSSVHCASPLVSVLFCFLSLIFYTYVPLLASCSSIFIYLFIYICIYLCIYLSFYPSIFSVTFYPFPISHLLFPPPPPAPPLLFFLLLYYPPLLLLLLLLPVHFFLLFSFFIHLYLLCFSPSFSVSKHSLHRYNILFTHDMKLSN